MVATELFGRRVLAGLRAAACVLAMLVASASPIAMGACGERGAMTNRGDGGRPVRGATALLPRVEGKPTVRPRPVAVDDDAGQGRPSELLSPWTLIALPDTQRYSELYPEIFASQTQWIVENRERLNIQIVVHLGDIVEHWDSLLEWDAAAASLGSLIDADIPLTPTPGDHDHEGQTPDGSTEYFYRYLPETRFNDDPWWGADYNNNTSHYVLLTIANDDYLFIGVDFCPSSDEIGWANGVLSAFAGRKAILVTHALIDDNGNYYGTSDCSRHQGDTSFIWNDLIRHHDNLQLVLCGHMHLNDGEYHRTVTNLNGVPVHQVLADYQMRELGGNGRLRIMTFDPAFDEIRVRTYSPYTDLYETDEDSQFTLPYEMGGVD